MDGNAKNSAPKNVVMKWLRHSHNESFIFFIMKFIWALYSYSLLRIYLVLQPIINNTYWMMRELSYWWTVYDNKRYNLPKASVCFLVLVCQVWNNRADMLCYHCQADAHHQSVCPNRDALSVDIKHSYTIPKSYSL